MLLSFYFFLRDDSQAKKMAERPVYFRVSAKSKSKYFSIGIKTKPIYWDRTKQRIKSGDPKASFKNKMIEIYYAKAENAYLDAVMKNKPLTVDNFIQTVKHGGNAHSFFDFTNQIIKEKKSSIGSATLKNYGFQLNKLKEFKSDFAVTDIDLSFIRNYQAYLKERGNNDSTQSKSLTFLRMICIEAVKHEIITKSPFLNFKIKEIKGKEGYLTFDELIKLENLYKAKTLQANKHNVLRYFLFACYTGIAHGDLSKLRFSDIKKVVINGVDYFVIDNERIKTGTRYRVPLIPKAVELLGKKFQPNQKLFNVLTNQPTNRYLKEIAKSCGIKTIVTFHLARHTFGTHGTSLGIPENFIMEMMGHKDKKVSRLYSKIQDVALIEMMNKSQGKDL